MVTGFTLNEVSATNFKLFYNYSAKEAISWLSETVTNSRSSTCFK